MDNSAITINFLVEDPSIQSIVRDYWVFEDAGGFAIKAPELAKRHKLSIAGLSALMRASAKVTQLRQICRDCQECRIISIRSEYKKVTAGSIEKYQCDECYEREWHKKRCEEEERKRAKELRVSQYIQDQMLPFDFSCISPEDAIYVLGLMELVGEFNPLRIPSVASHPVPYRGDPEATAILYRHLHKKGLLQPSHENSVGNFFETAVGDVCISSFNEMIWMLPDNSHSDDGYVSKESLLESAKEIEENRLCTLWADVVMNECRINYIRWYGLYRFKGEGFNDELEGDIRYALHSLSPGEVIHLLHYSIKHVSSNPGLPEIRTRKAEYIRKKIIDKFAECVKEWPKRGQFIYAFDRRTNGLASNYILNFYFDGDIGWAKLNLSNIYEYASSKCSELKDFHQGGDVIASP